MDIILNGQQLYSQKFYVEAAKKGEFFKDYIPGPLPASEVGAWRKNFLGPTGSVASAGGSQAIFQLPSRGTLLSDMYFEITLGAVTGSYCPLVAWNSVTNVLIDTSGEQLHNYNLSGPSGVMNYFQTLWLNETKLRYQTAAGGATPGAGTYYVPIPAFWTNFKHAGHEGMDHFQTPLPNLVLGAAPLNVTLTLNTVANMLASGGSGGSITSCRLIYYEFVIDPKNARAIVDYVNSPNYLAFGFDWQSVSNTTVATGTSTLVDMSTLQGALKEIIVSTVLVSDNDTNHNVFNQQNLTACSLQVDGVEIYKFSVLNENLMDQLIFNQSRIGVDPTYGSPLVINFSKRRDDAAWDGDLNSDIYKKFIIYVTHAAGANCYVGVLGTFYR